MPSSVYIKKSGQGYPLLLLHGWGFNHQIWSSITPNLEKNYTLYRVDLPGFGKTPSMNWNLFKQQILHALPPKFAVVGWSLGGLIATRLAIEASLHISHLINIASSPHFIAKGNWPGIKQSNLEAFYKTLIHTPQKTLHDFITLQSGNPLNHTLELPKHFNTEGLKAGLEILKTWDFRDALHAHTIPTAYLFGQLDSIIPQQTLEAMQAIYPQFHYTCIRKAGHAPFLSHPEAFLNILSEFIESN